MTLDAKIPEGPIEKKWDLHRFNLKLVNPANKRKYHIIVVGTGLAGASAAASLAELGYKVTAISYHESPRRAHSIAAQGGINAPKNYTNDGDSIYRLFYDTVKGGDYRAREANVYRLAQVSGNIIDQCVAQGVPFAREYGGLLDNRSFGGAQVSRTFYARGQTGQQLLLGAYSALSRQIRLGAVKFYGRRDVLDIIIADGQARGVVTRDMTTGLLETYTGDAVILATGGYANAYYLSTNAKQSNATAIWRAHKKGAFFANACFTQIHPTCIPVSSEHQSKLTLMSESLRNDGRIWVPKKQGETSATTIWNASILRSAIWSRAMLHPAVPKKPAIRVAASARQSSPSISILPTPSNATDATGLCRSTTTCSICISGSPMRTHSNCRCASIRPPTTPWEACGWIII
jgi:succinate dehydrogenase / fumarate reductase flavoprotein subunit